MKYVLLPLDQHADGGLGATGEAFEEAAKALSAQAETMRASPIHLPINFLYRHTIEFFLKSMIVVLHRELGVDYGGKPHDGSAFVPIGGVWKPLHKVHSVVALWAHALELLRSQADELGARCRTDWQAIPDGLDAAIAAIEKADGSSTYFRYPDARRPEGDAAKSSWKAKEPEDIVAQMQPGGKPVKVILLTQPDGTVSQAFQYDDAPLSELARVLAETAETLSSAHTGLRVELADGF